MPFCSDVTADERGAVRDTLPETNQTPVSSDMQFDNLGFSLDDIDEFFLAAAGKCRRDIVVGLLQRYRMQGLVGTHFLIKTVSFCIKQKFQRSISGCEFCRDNAHPRAVVNSMMTTKTVYSYGGFMAGGDSLTAARLWLRYRKAADGCSALRKDNYLRISYERLVADNDFSQSVVQSISGDSMIEGLVSVFPPRRARCTVWPNCRRMKPDQWPGKMNY